MLPSLSGLKPPQGASVDVTARQGLMPDGTKIDLGVWLKSDLLEEFMRAYDDSSVTTGFQITGVESFDKDPERKRALGLQMLKETEPQFREELKKWNNSGGQKIVLKYKYYPPPTGVPESTKLSGTLDFDPSIGITEQQFRRWYLVNNRCSSGSFFFKYAMDCLMALGYDLVLSSRSLGALKVVSVHEVKLKVPLALNAYQVTNAADAMNGQPNDAAYAVHGIAIGGKDDKFMGHKILLLKATDRRGDTQNIYVDVTARQVFPDLPIGTDVLIMAGDANLRDEYKNDLVVEDPSGMVRYNPGPTMTDVFLNKIRGCTAAFTSDYFANLQRVLQRYVSESITNVYNNTDRRSSVRYSPGAALGF
jgi:hypothetical protein